MNNNEEIKEITKDDLIRMIDEIFNSDEYYQIFKIELLI